MITMMVFFKTSFLLTLSIFTCGDSLVVQKGANNGKNKNGGRLTKIKKAKSNSYAPTSNPAYKNPPPPRQKLNASKIEKYVEDLYIPIVLYDVNETGNVSEVSMRQITQQVLPCGFPKTTLWAYYMVIRNILKLIIIPPGPSKIQNLPPCRSLGLMNLSRTLSNAAIIPVLMHAIIFNMFFRTSMACQLSIRHCIGLHQIKSAKREIAVPIAKDIARNLTMDQFQLQLMLMARTLSTTVIAIPRIGSCQTLATYHQDTQHRELITLQKRIIQINPEKVLLFTFMTMMNLPRRYITMIIR